MHPFVCQKERQRDRERQRETERQRERERLSIEKLMLNIQFLSLYFILL